VVLGRREHVEDAAAHGELAALLDKIGAVVCRGRKGLDDLLEGGGVAGAQGHGLEVAQTLGDRLQDRPDRGDDHPQRAVGRVVGVRVRQPTQHGQPGADGVGARGKTFVRKGFP
jgi:hypothetical protein